jgi:hypothetical protein
VTDAQIDANTLFGDSAVDKAWRPLRSTCNGWLKGSLWCLSQQHHWADYVDSVAWRSAGIRGTQSTAGQRGLSQIPGQLHDGHESQGSPTMDNWSGFAPTYYNYPKVNKTNEIHAIRSYIDEQREQMQQIIGGMQDDYKRLACAFDKSVVVNFPSHEVKTKENAHNSSAANWPWPIPSTSWDVDEHVSWTTTASYTDWGKSTDLRAAGPSAHEHGLSGLAAADPVFRTKPLKSALGPLYSMQTLKVTYRPSAYTAGQPGTDYAGRNVSFHHPSLCMSQPSFPLLPMARQHHSIAPMMCGDEHVFAPRRLEKDDQPYEPPRASINAP